MPTGIGNITGYVAHNISVVKAGLPIQSIAINSSGWYYAVVGTDAYSPWRLYISTDLTSWILVNSNLFPPGYFFSGGRDLTITKEDSIILTPTKQVDLEGERLNFTTFFLSTNYGKTFSVVLNQSLSFKMMNPNADLKDMEWAGWGVWHRIAETSNGTLFAGLYNPQSLAYKSGDGGRSWTLVFNGSSYGSYANEIHDVEYDPYNNGIYIAVDDEFGSLPYNRTLFVSIDYGEHWRNLWNEINGGSNLPSGAWKLIPETMSFVCGGRAMFIGFDSRAAQYIASMQVYPNGSLWKIGQIDTNSSMSDYYNDCWQEPYNASSVLIGPCEFGLGESGIGVTGKVQGLNGYLVSSQGSIQTLFNVGPHNIAQYVVNPVSARAIALIPEGDSASTYFAYLVSFSVT
jgi:hypothetical protein